MGLWFLALAAIEFLKFQAMAGAAGYPWVLMGIEAIFLLAFGYFAGAVAMARSRDAFGHGYYVALAFIPIANFVLVFKGSKSRVSTNRIRTPPPVTGKLGVLAGTVLFGMGVALKVQSALTVASAEGIFGPARMDAAAHEMYMEMVVGLHGLEVALAHIPVEVVVPEAVDGAATLLSKEPDTDTVRYNYAVPGENPFMPDASDLIRGTCGYGPLQPVLQAGGGIEHAYYTAAGDRIGAVRVTAEECG